MHLRTSFHFTLHLSPFTLFSMHIVQILPALNEGGVERGTVELNREFVKCGHRSTVISAGGKLSGQIDRDGGEHIALDVKSKNPLTALSRAGKLKNTFGGFKSFHRALSQSCAWMAVYYGE